MFKKFNRLVSISLLLILLFQLTSCTSNTNSEMVSMYDFQKELINSDSSLPEMLTSNSSSENAEDDFSYISNLSYDKVEGFFVAYASDGSAYEIAVICLKNETDIQIAKQSLNEHKESRERTYQNYKPTEAKYAKDAEIVTDGRYVALIMCRDQKTVINAFHSFLAK